MPENRAPSGLTVVEVLDWWINTFLPPGDARSTHPYAVPDLRWIGNELGRLYAENARLIQANEQLQLQNQSLVEQRDRLVQTRTPDEDVEQSADDVRIHQEGCDASDHNKRVHRTGELRRCPYADGTHQANIWQAAYRYRDMVNDG